MKYIFGISSSRRLKWVPESCELLCGNWAPLSIKIQNQFFLVSNWKIPEAAHGVEFKNGFVTFLSIQLLMSRKRFSEILMIASSTNQKLQNKYRSFCAPPKQGPGSGGGGGVPSQLQAKTTPSGVYPQAAESGYDTATNWHQHLVSYIQACPYVAYCMSVHGVHATSLWAKNTQSTSHHTAPFARWAFRWALL